MKLPSFPQVLKKKKESHYVAIDLGSSSIKAAIFATSKALATEKILGISRQPYAPHSMYAGQVTDFDAVADALAAVLDEASIKAGVVTHEAVIGVSGGISYAKGLRVRTKRRDPEKILDEKEFDMLADHIEEQTLDAAREELAQRFEGELVRIETNFTAFAMDGARVDSPLGLPGEELEVAVMHYFMEESRLRVLNNLADELGLDLLALVNTSVNYAVHQIQAHPSFVVVDVGGSVTEIVVVEDGKVVSNEVFLMGGDDITWQIHQDFDVSEDKAERMKINYLMGHMDEEKKGSIQPSIQKATQAMVEGIATVLSELHLVRYPSQFFLTGEGRHLTELHTSLKEFPWTRLMHFDQEPRFELAEGQSPNLNALTKLITSS